MTQCNEIY